MKRKNVKNVFFEKIIHFCIIHENLTLFLKRKHKYPLNIFVVNSEMYFKHNIRNECYFFFYDL